MGLIGITTLVLMIAATIGNGITAAEAQRDRGSFNTEQRVNQNAQGGGTGEVGDQQGLINVGVGNADVRANVAVPVDAAVCGTQVSVIGSDNQNSARC